MILFFFVFLHKNKVKKQREKKRRNKDISLNCDSKKAYCSNREKDVRMKDTKNTLYCFFDRSQSVNFIVLIFFIYLKEKRERTLLIRRPVGIHSRI